jgi:hypothetical protein
MFFRALADLYALAASSYHIFSHLLMKRGVCCNKNSYSLTYEVFASINAVFLSKSSILKAIIGEALITSLIDFINPSCFFEGFFYS